ncbi:MAG: ATP-dependent DNA helicase [Proteobacteria bacterium]|nr:ATP-dependent DNA helicase [Pseudomonadota bacterium]
MTISADIFDVQGPIASALSRYELRDAQVEMTRAVEEAIDRGGVLLAEAGTGTGKTLAYLVPAIVSEQTVVISTRTKNLQEQVFFKDIDFLKSAFDKPLSAVYLKGQDNYLCLRRHREFVTSPKVLAYSPNRVEELEDWARQTKTGDRMELEGLPDNDPMWREVCSSREARIGAKCSFGADCFVTKARLRAMRAKLIVVNHHLYFADLVMRLKGSSILPPHDVVIFDEAHVIEDVATEFFSTSVSSSKIDRVLRDLENTVRNAKLENDPAKRRRPDLIKTAKAASKDLFTMFRGSDGRSRLIPEELDGTSVEKYHRLDSGLDAVEKSLKSIEGCDETVDHISKRIEGLRADLFMVIAQTSKGFVHWIENRKRSVVLGASPIDISEMLRQGIFLSIPTVVLTSATLSTGGDFAFLKSRLGIDFDVKELSLPSPFNFEEQARIYLPTHLPDPRDSKFSDEAASESVRLIDLTKGGALFLFTSVRNMRTTYNSLKGRVPDLLMLQGEAPKSTLFKRFIENPNSVLCATASFWQGVDIPGDALRLVIIDKLPFASPGDPLVAARIEHLLAGGHKPFIEYQVPQAALSLKQGFGRLIRTKFDRGIVAILDRRLHTMPYASVFLNSLPTCPVLSSFENVSSWWNSSKATH